MNKDAKAMRIKLTLKGMEIEAELLESQAAIAFAERLPVQISLSRWGEEYYGGLGEPLGAFSGPTAEVLEPGDLAYWEPGNAFCIFFGPTPASRENEPRAASAVHIIGRLDEDFSFLTTLPNRVEAAVYRV